VIEEIMGLQKYFIYKYVKPDKGWRYCRPGTNTFGCSSSTERRCACRAAFMTPIRR